MQIHAPAPAAPTPRRHSAQYTQLPPHTQHAQAIARPPSRSERLLRDTLLRDDKERHPVPPSPRRNTHPQSHPHAHLQPQQPRNHSRRPSYSSYSSASASGDHSPQEYEYGYDDDDDREDDREADEQWMRGTVLFRTPMAAPAPAGLVRNKSLGHRRETSPSPSSHRYSAQHYQQQQLPQHQGHGQPQRAPLQRSANSMPTSLPRSPPASPPSRPASFASPPAARSRSHSHSTSLSMQLTPHEAVLRARLEKVLSMGRDESAREREAHDWTSSPSSAGSESPPSSHSHSHAHSPPRSHSRPHAHAPGPHTPPDSPAFNARTASALCRQMEGYVSFACVEGLGEQQGMDAGSDEEAFARGLGRGGLKVGLERLWRAWGKEREGAARSGAGA